MRQPKSCYAKAVELLARRSHFRLEMRRKLGQRRYDESEIEHTLERLAAEGLIDDCATARELVASRLRREPVGRRKLMAELARRGVESEVVEEVLGELVPDDDLDLARDAAERWCRRSPGKPPAALGRHLERRGFSRRAVLTLVRQLGDDGEIADDV